MSDEEVNAYAEQIINSVPQYTQREGHGSRRKTLTGHSEIHGLHDRQLLAKEIPVGLITERTLCLSNKSSVGTRFPCKSIDRTGLTSSA